MEKLWGFVRNLPLAKAREILGGLAAYCCEVVGNSLFYLPAGWVLFEACTQPEPCVGFRTFVMNTKHTEELSFLVGQFGQKAMWKDPVQKYLSLVAAEKPADLHVPFDETPEVPASSGAGGSSSASSSAQPAPASSGAGGSSSASSSTQPASSSGQPGQGQAQAVVVEAAAQEEQAEDKQDEADEDAAAGNTAGEKTDEVEKSGEKTDEVEKSGEKTDEVKPADKAEKPEEAGKGNELPGGKPADTGQQPAPKAAAAKAAAAKSSGGGRGRGAGGRGRGRK